MPLPHGRFTVLSVDRDAVLALALNRLALQDDPASALSVRKVMDAVNGLSDETMQEVADCMAQYLLNEDAFSWHEALTMAYEDNLTHLDSVLCVPA